MKKELYRCPDVYPICIEEECPHAIAHEYNSGCNIQCNYNKRTCIKIEEQTIMEISNEHEAKAFYIFMNLEKQRHKMNIIRINEDLEKLIDKWGFYFTI